MDTRRAGLLLLILFGIAGLAWNSRVSSIVEVVPATIPQAADLQEAKQDPARLRQGQSVGYTALTDEMKQIVDGLTDVVVLRTWATPSWLHAVSATAKDDASKELRTQKLRECPLTLLAQWVFDEGCVGDFTFAIDIGMNLGWFSALAAASGLHVLAVEPRQAPLRYMEKTIALNGWQGRIDLLHGGLAEASGQLYVDESRWWERRSASRQAGDGRSATKALRLDDAVPPDSKVCLLKADCRGCEAEAFRSGKELLAAGSIQVVQMEYDHSPAAQSALETLQQLSPRPWQCILLPAGLRCAGADLLDAEGEALREIWDFIVAGVHIDCRAAKLVETAPEQVLQGYHTDLWLVHDDTMDRLRAEPRFVAASQRVAEAANLQCEYSSSQTAEQGVCDLLCHEFTTLEEAQRACDARPSCTKVLQRGERFELRGGSAPGSAQVPAYLKLACKLAQ
ncbi:unnamed protein product [Symbiodinium sp. CCMP2456]|nr:unnamed protein product [Symbiodinium sp. CCMP2456]